MFKLTLAQRLSNLMETRDGLVSKIQKLQVELERVDRKIALTQSKLQDQPISGLSDEDDPDLDELTSTHLF